MDETTKENQASSGKKSRWDFLDRYRTSPTPQTETANQKFDRLKQDTTDITTPPIPKENISLAHSQLKEKMKADLQRQREEQLAITRAAMQAEVTTSPSRDKALAEMDLMMGDTVASGEFKGGVSVPRAQIVVEQSPSRSDAGRKLEALKSEKDIPNNISQFPTSRPNSAENDYSRGDAAIPISNRSSQETTRGKLSRIARNIFSRKAA